MTDDEIISIEDTYKETNAMSSKKESSIEEGCMNIRNKSMTIIEEDDDESEESSVLNN